MTFPSFDYNQDTLSLYRNMFSCGKIDHHTTFWPHHTNMQVQRSRKQMPVVKMATAFIGQRQQYLSFHHRLDGKASRSSPVVQAVYM